MFKLYAQRARLLLNSDSLYLNRLLQDSIKKVWFQNLGIDEADLTQIQRFEIDFVVGGFVAAMRPNAHNVDARFAKKLLSTPMFQAAIKSVSAMGKNPFGEAPEAAEAPEAPEAGEAAEAGGVHAGGARPGGRQAG